MKANPPVHSANYDRPVRATLHVHLDNGESWPVTEDDLKRFRLDFVGESYMRFDDALRNALVTADLLPSGDITDARLNPIRYLAELAICNPDILASHPVDGPVADVERALQVREAVQ